MAKTGRQRALHETGTCYRTFARPELHRLKPTSGTVIEMPLRTKAQNAANDQRGGAGPELSLKTKTQCEKLGWRCSSHKKRATAIAPAAQISQVIELIVLCRLATAACREPSLHIPVVSAFCVEHRQQETLAPVKEAQPQKITTDEGPNTVGNP